PDPAVYRSPIPYWDVECSTGGIAEVTDASLRSGSVDGEATGIDAVKVIQRDRRQVSSLGREYFEPRRTKALHGCIELWVVSAGLLFYLLHRRKRRCESKVVDGGEVLVEIGKDENSQFQMSAIHLELRFAQSALSIVGLQL